MPKNSFYRFSPIKGEQEFINAVNHIYEQSKELLDRFKVSVAAPESMTIFSHYPEEYAFLDNLLASKGSKGTDDKYVLLDEPLKMDDGQLISKMRVRRPDPYRSQVGCVDFRPTHPSKTNLLIQEYPNNTKQIRRSGVVLSELSDPDYDTLVYLIEGKTAINDDKKSTPLTEVKIFADGGSRGNPGPSASGYVVLDMQDKIIKKRGIYIGITTNNQAEYRALKFGLEDIHDMGIEKVHVYMDSLLVINQLKGAYKVKNKDLWPIYSSIQQLAGKFREISFSHVPRELNKLADGMVNESLDAGTDV